MSSFERCRSAICEKCDKQFMKSFTVYNSLNLDYKSTYKDLFTDDKLNVVKCPHCKSSFVYERPFIAYSIHKGYAVYAIPSLDENFLYHGKKELYDIFKIPSMKFRLVNYLCEVSEKVKIFEYGLNDLSIEYVKNKFFDQHYFSDKKNNMLLFKEIDGDNIVFEYRDYLGNVIETHFIPKGELDVTINFKEKPFTDDNLVKWIKIDNNFIRENLYD